MRFENVGKGKKMILTESTSELIANIDVPEI